MGGAELLGPGFLAVVDVYRDDLACAVLHGALDDGQTYASGTEDGDGGVSFDVGRHNGGAVAGRDAAAEETRPVHGGFVGDGDDRNVGDNGVLGEGGGAHKVQQVPAFALEA